MSLGFGFLLVYVASLGLPVLAVGVVMRLIEFGMDKPRWSLGSGFFLVVGGVFFLPFVLWIICAGTLSLVR